MIFGLVSNCWRVQLAQGEAIERLLEQAVAQGWQWVELRQGCLGACERPDDRFPLPAALGRVADSLPELRLGLALAWPAFGSPGPREKELFARGVESALALARGRSPMLRLVDLANSGQDTAETAQHADRFAESWGRLAQPLAQAGGALAIENASQPWRLLVDAVRSTRRALGEHASAMRICFDACNLFKAADRPEPAESLRSLAVEELSMVHIKQTLRGQPLTAVGEGDVDWRAQGQALESLGYDGPALFEIESHREVWRNLAQSREFLAGRHPWWA